MFQLINGHETLSEVKYLKKDAAVALSKNTFGMLDTNKLAVEADATATNGNTFFIVWDAPVGTTEVGVIGSEKAIFEGKADATLTDLMKGTECDIVIVSGEQRVDVAASTTDVFTVLNDITFKEVRTEDVAWVPTAVEYVRVKLTGEFR